MESLNAKISYRNHLIKLSLHSSWKNEAFKNIEKYQNIKKKLYQINFFIREYLILRVIKMEIELRKSQNSKLKKKKHSNIANKKF